MFLSKLINEFNLIKEKKFYNQTRFKDVKFLDVLSHLISLTDNTIKKN